MWSSCDPQCDSDSGSDDSDSDSGSDASDSDSGSDSARYTNILFVPRTHTSQYHIHVLKH